MKALALVFLAACGGSSMMAADDDDTPDGGGGSSTADGAIYPMKKGDLWMFEVTAVGAGSVCSPGMYSQRVLSANPVGTRAAFQLDSFCTGVTATYDYALSGDNEVDFYYQGTWLTLVDPTLAEGHSWPYFNTSYHWHRETSVTVPAGTYDDCWTAQQDVSYTAYLTYCRGVGLVRSYSADLTGAGWDAKLVSSSL